MQRVPVQPLPASTAAYKVHTGLLTAGGRLQKAGSRGTPVVTHRCRPDIGGLGVVVHVG